MPLNVCISAFNQNGLVKYIETVRNTATENADSHRWKLREGRLFSFIECCCFYTTANPYKCNLTYLSNLEILK